MNHLLIRLSSFLAPVTVVSAVLTLWAIAERAWVAAPLAVFFVTTAFTLTIARPGPLEALPASDGPRRCTGCRAGCVECRERIDVPDAA